MIGILGGMGPIATAEFYTTLLRMVGKTTHDREYPSVVIYSDPTIPSRTRAFLYGEEDPTPYLVKGLERLKLAGATVAVCPCNSASFFLKKIPNPPLGRIDIVDVTIQRCLELKLNRILLLGGEIIRQSNLYSASLPVIEINQKEQDIVNGLIYTKKKTGSSPCMNFDFLTDKYQVDGIILGCTELTTIESGVVVVNSSYELARATLNYYNQEIKR